MKLALPEDRFPYIFSVFYFIFNSFFISRVLALTHDSIYYYDEILTRPDNLFPHHLLFTPFISRFSALLKLLGINSDLIAISLVNTIAGSVILIIIYKILSENFKYTKTASRISVLICAFSFSFWFYNLNIETYHLPLVFVFSSIYFLTREHRKKRDLYFSAVLGGIGVLFHQLHGLFGLTVVIFLAISGFKKNLKQIIVFTIIFNFIWIAGYSIAIYYLDLKSFAEVSRWFFLYHHEMDGWSTFNSTFFIAPLIGFLRSFVSINGLFINSTASEFMFGYFKYQNLEDDAYILRNIASFEFYIYIILLLTLAVLIIYVAVSNFSIIKQTFLKISNRIILIIFFLIYSGFFIFWAPVNLEFWIPQSLAFWIIFSASFNNTYLNKKNILVAVGIIIILFYVNFRYTIILTKDFDNDLYYSEVQKAKELLPPGSIIFYEHGWIIDKYYEIYAPEITFISLDKNFIPQKQETFEKDLQIILKNHSALFIQAGLEKNYLVSANDSVYQTELVRIGQTDFIKYFLSETNGN
jgi:hypothetical protein